MGLAVAVLAFTLYFFRDPDRSPPTGSERQHVLLAPADGKVVDVVDEAEPQYLNGPSTRVSIFLSPLDVHVNRIPADGVIEFERYVPGDYLVAWHPKASEKNERSNIPAATECSSSKLPGLWLAGSSTTFTRATRCGPATGLGSSSSALAWTFTCHRALRSTPRRATAFALASPCLAASRRLMLPLPRRCPPSRRPSNDCDRVTLTGCG